MGKLIDHLRANVPASMLRAANWVAWKLEPSDSNKPTKVPYASDLARKGPARKGPARKASTTDPATWGNIEHAAKRAARDRLSGVGYVFAAETPEDHPYVSDKECGIDLDHCGDRSAGHLDEWALQIVRRIGSYTEWSQSGEGLHIILEGRLPDDAKHTRPYATGKIEVYDRGRFFTMTGDHPGGDAYRRRATPGGAGAIPEGLSATRVHSGRRGAPQPHAAPCGAV
jgi:primase-polymerase (primpol)-like protein